MANSYPFMRESAGMVPCGIAVQDGNYEHRNPKTGQQVTVSELVDFAAHYLRVTYIFWGTQEPYYSQTVLPLLRALQK